MVNEDPTLHVMSFNIRVDTGNTFKGDPDCWIERESILQKFLKNEQPDLLGVQEAMYHQIPAIQEGLSSKYSYIGESRDSSALGELGPIFYNTERLHLNHWEQLWLSDDPTIPESNTWGSDAVRIVTWGNFTDKMTGRNFTAANTHLDHISEYSRIRSAELLVNLFSGYIPIVLTGDFNADSKQEPKEYDVLTQEFQDVFITSPHHLNPRYGTFNDYREPSLTDRTIDWILSSRDVEVCETSTHTFTVDGRFPSDHLPISARLQFC